MKTKDSIRLITSNLVSNNTKVYLLLLLQGGPLPDLPAGAGQPAGLLPLPAGAVQPRPRPPPHPKHIRRVSLLPHLQHVPPAHRGGQDHGTLVWFISKSLSSRAPGVALQDSCQVCRHSFDLLRRLTATRRLVEWPELEITRARQGTAS